MKKKIKKFDFDLTPINEEAFEKAKKKYIAEFSEYFPGGFMTSGEYILNPAAGEAKWNFKNPTYTAWLEGRTPNLNSTVLIIKKIDEIIDFLNKQ